MRPRILLFSTLTAVLLLVALPQVTHAQIPFFGPIIPPDGQACAAGWGLVLIVINRIIRVLLSIAIVFVAPLSIAYAGFLFVVNPTSAGDISKAKSVITHTVVGIVVALASWLIVDAVMAVLYKPTAEGLGGRAWWQLVGSGGADRCIPLAASQRPSERTGVSTTTYSYPPPTGTGACDPNALKAIIPSLTESQANTFACIAKYESNCGSKMLNYAWDKPIASAGGKASTAYGAFQVTLSGNNAAYENQACYDVVSLPAGQKLTCNLGFGPKGFLAGGNEEILERCLQAASNLACNFNAAYKVYQSQGFGAWTTDPNAKSQQQCINMYASS